MTVKRGEIYWVDFDPSRGSEQAGRRPALVVQNDVGNANSSTTVVVAITRTVPKKAYPFAVVVDPSASGLPSISTINCAQILTLQQAGPQSRLLPPPGEQTLRPIGRLSSDKMAEVDRALKYNLGLE